jgi:serine/threonine protein kinase
MHGVSSEYFPMVSDVYISENNAKVFMVEEHVVGGDLFEYISSQEELQEEENCKELFRNLLSAVALMHSAGITHRDLKPENIFLKFMDNANSIMIGDFGQSHSTNPKISGAAPWVNPNSMDTFVGTVDYMAPEMVKNQKGEGESGADSSYSTLVDEWACGCIFYLCLTGVLPFSTDANGNALSTPKIFNNILNSNKVTFPAEFQFSDSCKVRTRRKDRLLPKNFRNPIVRILIQPNPVTFAPTPQDLITLLLEAKPDRRITAKEALELSFFKDVPDRPSHLTDAAIARRKSSLNNTMVNLKNKRRDSIDASRRNSLSRRNR